MTAITLSQAVDAGDVLRLALAAAPLPADELGGPDQLFLCQSNDRCPIGFVGVERSGPDRLLRSLAVLRTRRGQGHGHTLVERWEVVGKGAVDRFHLLPTGTGSFVRRLGYVDGDRTAAPADIAAAARFSSLCGPRTTHLVKDPG